MHVQFAKHLHDQMSAKHALHGFVLVSMQKYSLLLRTFPLRFCFIYLVRTASGESVKVHVDSSTNFKQFLHKVNRKLGLPSRLDADVRAVNEDGEGSYFHVCVCLSCILIIILLTELGLLSSSDLTPYETSEQLKKEGFKNFFFEHVVRSSFTDRSQRYVDVCVLMLVCCRQLQDYLLMHRRLFDNRFDRNFYFCAILFLFNDMTNLA
jgi:hypothetical protein